MKTLFWPVFLSMLSCHVVAQGRPNGGPDGGEQQKPHWSLGVAAILKDSPYTGEGTRALPFPLISYQGENFYFRGGSAGWTFLRNESFEVTALAKMHFGAFSVDDLGKEQLAKNGIDYRLLQDRESAADAGLEIKWEGNVGEIELKLLVDVTDTSGGQELSVQYAYPIPFANGMLQPNISVNWLSKDNANYYYGTLDEEVARGVVNYKPNAVIIPDIGLSYFRPINDKWSLMSSLTYSVLPDEITNSPLIESGTDGTVSIFIGISRDF